MSDVLDSAHRKNCDRQGRIKIAMEDMRRNSIFLVEAAHCNQIPKSTLHDHVHQKSVRCTTRTNGGCTRVCSGLAFRTAREETIKHNFNSELRQAGRKWLNGSLERHKKIRALIKNQRNGRIKPKQADETPKSNDACIHYFSFTLNPKGFAFSLVHRLLISSNFEHSRFSYVLWEWTGLVLWIFNRKIWILNWPFMQ